METPSDLELSTFPSRTSSTRPLSTADALPPVDKGRAAWSFLAAATVIEVLVWGLPFSVGVLHSYWTTVLFPPGTPGESLIALAATLQVRFFFFASRARVRKGLMVGGADGADVLHVCAIFSVSTCGAVAVQLVDDARAGCCFAFRVNGGTSRRLDCCAQRSES